MSATIVIFASLNIANVSPLSASILILPQLLSGSGWEGVTQGSSSSLQSTKCVKPGTCQGSVTCWFQRGDSLPLLYLLHLNKWKDFWNFDIAFLRKKRRTSLMVCVLLGVQVGRNTAHVLLLRLCVCLHWLLKFILGEGESGFGFFLH